MILGLAEFVATVVICILAFVRIQKFWAWVKEVWLPYMAYRKIISSNIETFVPIWQEQIELEDKEDEES